MPVHVYCHREKVMVSHRDWKQQLQEIIAIHDSQHATRAKLVAFRTMEARSQILFRCFALLRVRGVSPGPRQPWQLQNDS
ncbi:hypothetical protein [Massilia soli]|nr:hypothetical protein [Massilia soli]